jgi:hypothetical protein
VEKKLKKYAANLLTRLFARSKIIQDSPTVIELIDTKDRSIQGKNDTSRIDTCQTTKSKYQVVIISSHKLLKTFETDVRKSVDGT